MSLRVQTTDRKFQIAKSTVQNSAHYTSSYERGYFGKLQNNVIICI